MSLKDYGISLENLNDIILIDLNPYFSFFEHNGSVYFPLIDTYDLNRVGDEIRKLHGLSPIYSDGYDGDSWYNWSCLVKRYSKDEADVDLLFEFVENGYESDEGAYHISLSDEEQKEICDILKDQCIEQFDYPLEYLLKDC